MADYNEFWILFLRKAINVIPLYQGVSPTTKHYLHTKKGVVGPFCTTFNTKKSIAHVEICFQKSKTESKAEFDRLFSRKQGIEQRFGEQLRWERLPEKERSKIMSEPVSFHYNDKSTWNKTIENLLEKMSRFIPAIEHLSPERSISATPISQKQINEEFLPDWNYVKAIIDQMPHKDPTIDEILDQVEMKALTEKKVLKQHWREITRRNIPIWLTAIHE